MRRRYLKRREKIIINRHIRGELNPRARNNWQLVTAEEAMLHRMFDDSHGTMTWTAYLVLNNKRVGPEIGTDRSGRPFVMEYEEHEMDPLYPGDPNIRRKQMQGWAPVENFVRVAG